MGRGGGRVQNHARNVVREEDASQDATRAWRVGRPMELEDRKEKGRKKGRKREEKRKERQNEGKKTGKGRKEERKEKEREGKGRKEGKKLGVVVTVLQSGSTRFCHLSGRTSTSARVPKYFVLPPDPQTRRPTTPRTRKNHKHANARTPTHSARTHRPTTQRTQDTIAPAQGLYHCVSTAYSDLPCLPLGSFSRPLSQGRRESKRERKEGRREGRLVS